MRHALIIANGVYAEKEFDDLPGTVRDADSLREVLKDPEIGAFDTVTVLRNRPIRDIGLAVAKHFGEGRPEDVLLLHISAHGKKDDDGRLFFAASDSSSRATELRYTALSAEHVQHEMARSLARQIIVLLDCCYSGAFARGLRSRGVPDLAEPFRGRGHVVITACTSNEFSHEDEQGVFTRAVVEGLRTGEADSNGDGVVDTEELHRYAARVLRRAEHRQRPTLSSYRREGIIAVGWVPGRRPADQGRPSVPPAGRPTPRRPRDRLVPLPDWPPLHGALPRRVVLPLLAVCALLVGSTGHADPTGTASTGCHQPTRIRVATSVAGHLPYQEVADAFERWSARRTGGCPSARIYLFPASDEDLRAGIRAGWGSSGEPDHRFLRDVGPHPDLWLPESASELDRLGGAGAGVVTEVQPVAWSPLVLGVPTGRLAGADADHRAMTMAWPELFRRAVRSGPDGDGWGVVRADPKSSAVGRLATHALYLDRGELIPASQARQRVEQFLDRSLDAGSYPIGDDVAVLCRQRILAATAPAGRTPAVILTEQSLVRYNQGLPIGASCTTRHVPPRAERLQAFYPADSPVLFSSVARLRWPDAVQGERVRAAANTFVRWLASEDDGKQALLRAGLRPAGHDIGAPVDNTNGALREWPFGLPRPLREALVTDQDRARRIHLDAHRPGRVLVALDASGSMRSPSEDRRRTRFEVAVDGVGRSVEQMGRRDEFGLVTFSTAAGNSRQLVPIGHPGVVRAASLRAALQRVRPSGDTPLYRTLRQGVTQLRAGDGDPLRALVVLTDGQDTSGQPAPPVAALAGVRLYVLAVGDVACAGSTLDRLARGTGGDCYDTRADSIDDVLSRLFAALWEGAQ
ncbi:caspase family protein [Micromonospora sp. CPCC 205546]|uniref:caspase, EACC1-associated type n=1 Tax=Micromonospora sp. CPCC 205546 TaxID=3122397 RepID=UPI002FF3C28A